MARKPSSKPDNFLTPFNKLAETLDPSIALEKRLKIADDLATKTLTKKERQKISPYFAFHDMTVGKVVLANKAANTAVDQLNSLDYISNQEESNIEAATKFLRKDGLDEGAIQEALSSESGIKRVISHKWTEFHKVSSTRQEEIKKQINALRAILNWRTILNDTEQNGTSFHSPKFYLQRAFKESQFIPTAKSETGALGLMQLTGSARRGVAKHFNITNSRSDVYYEGADAEKQAAVSTKNLETGILYWYVCENKYVKKHAKELSTKLDINRATAFAYNIGPEAFRRLWNTLNSTKKPFTNYSEFETALSKVLIRKVPAARNNPSKHLDSKGYKVRHRSLFKIVRNGKDKKGKSKVLTIPPKIKIGPYSYETWQIIDAIHFARIIDEISASRFIQKPPIKTAQR